MKRMFALLLLATILFGCASNKIKRPAAFYYPPEDYVHTQDGSILDFETRETAHLLNMAAVLDLYMQGPQNIRFRNPFPSGCKVISLRHYDTTLELVISDELAQLSGVSLPLACAALAKTCMDLTGAETIRIRAERLTLGSEKEIVMKKNTLNISSIPFSNETNE